MPDGGFWDGMSTEFADTSLIELARLAVRLVVAAGVGAAIGWEREAAGKSAGLRTHILVALGTCAFVAIAAQAGFGPNELSRVIQGLVAGVGFLGAGCILKPHHGHVTGLTTAAGIWLTAAVGVTAGLGREVSALLVGSLGWFTLVVLVRVERGGPTTR